MGLKTENLGQDSVFDQQEANIDHLLWGGQFAHSLQRKCLHLFVRVWLEKGGSARIEDVLLNPPFRDKWQASFFFKLWRISLERNSKIFKEVKRLWEEVSKVARFNASLRPDFSAIMRLVQFSQIGVYFCCSVPFLVDIFMPSYFLSFFSMKVQFPTPQKHFLLAKPKSFYMRLLWSFPSREYTHPQSQQDFSESLSGLTK